MQSLGLVHAGSRRHEGFSRVGRGSSHCTARLTRKDPAMPARRTVVANQKAPHCGAFVFQPKQQAPVGRRDG